jgi:AraC-like DNA-binding protein
MFNEHISAEVILFFILYGVTGAVALLAAIYLLLRRGNAFAPDVTPPLRLRRWAASFFVVGALGHVWWYLFFIFADDIHSVDAMLHSASYVAFAFLDGVTLLATIAGTLLAMLQDRKRPVWPVFAAMLPFVALGGVLMVSPSEWLMQVAFAYLLLLYVLFSVYMAFAVRQYGRWLRDNYADLERKEVWLTHVLSLVFMLLFIFYALVDASTIFVYYLLHIVELALFVLLLWRVETLPQLDVVLTPEPSLKEKSVSTVDLAQIEQLLKEHCVDKQLYLQHELSLLQLAQIIGTNRSYLSHYFSRQGITYNIYINNLRVNHFISRYQELAATGQAIVAQDLAQESGFRSYSTFGRAFMQRTGQSVTAWMHDTSE